MIPEKKTKVFIDVLLELSDGGTDFSDDDIRDEVITMIIGVNILNYYLYRLIHFFCLLNNQFLLFI